MKLSKLDQTLYIISIITVLLILGSCDLKTTELDLKSRPYHKAFTIEDANADNYCTNSPECYKTDENGEIPTFNLSPPKNAKEWQIKRVELVGNYNDYQRHWMNVAYKISNYDKEFMYMLKGENGLFNHDRRSLVIQKDGNREPSYGFCQIHKGFHPQIVNDERFFTDPKWQLEQCYRLWKGGTKFYGYRHREKAIKHFNFTSI